MSGRPRLALDPVLVAACALFLAIGWWATGLLPVGHEEISCFPNRAAQVLGVDRERGGLSVEPSCVGGDAILVSSDVRPELSLCVGGLSLPLLVTSYASGVPYWHALLGWPLHGGDAFSLRRWNLFAGLISLVLAFLLVLRLTGERALARATALVLSVSPAFLLLHTMLLQYETTPWMLTAAALLVALGDRDGAAPSTRRMSAAGLLVGLAILANIKALFTLAIIMVVAWRSGVLGRISRTAWVAAARTAAIGPALLLVFNALQGGSSLRTQSISRLSILLQPVTASDVVAEAVNLMRFGTDTGSYGTSIWRLQGAAGLAAAALFAVVTLYAIGVGLRFLLRGGTQSLLAGCGLLVAAYFGISLKLYDQEPPANYAPLYVVFGLTQVLGLGALARALSRTGWRVFRTPSTTVLVLATTCALLLGAGAVRRIDGVRTLSLSFNAHAERALATYLLEHPLPGVPLHTTTYNLAGVLDSLGRGALSSRRLDRLLRCDGDDVTPEACLPQEWREILRTPGVVPTRLVLPDVETLTDENDSAVMQAALEQAVREAGLRLTREATFQNAEGRRALLLVRIDRGP